MSSNSVPDPTSVRDREAVEHVLGRPLDQHWPAAALTPGSRVSVLRDAEWDGPWQCEFLGAIDALGAPEPVRHPHARSGELVYWVSFDEPHYDAAGNGPYRKAQIWDRYLQPKA
ncbi:ferrous iron transport protein A [Streptomyces sp. So13.3]|uniref:ferrous iron transport protein A n=1 Tax=Streptomyces sp. So13.3 TaxID=2136173 RepID=UPI001106AB95|nr:ferrous iron transport protein A [Streptomyces sp. So13.3]QNA72017.1 ferrous iron transport protein A [Streptomyces sp. So13.3]